jgi:hypothetical protein
MAAMGIGGELRSPDPRPPMIFRPAPVKSASGVLPDRATPARHLTGPWRPEPGARPEPQDRRSQRARRSHRGAAAAQDPAAIQARGGRSGLRPGKPAAAACQGQALTYGNGTGNTPGKALAGFT